MRPRGGDFDIATPPVLDDLLRDLVDVLLRLEHLTRAFTGGPSQWREPLWVDLPRGLDLAEDWLPRLELGEGLLKPIRALVTIWMLLCAVYQFAY
ncbi:MAG: hypothetical protein HYX75_06950 [Acidobacteria bacterium]|nr:hypothetical protein [Acidobacteriota bacterium]